MGIRNAVIGKTAYSKGIEDILKKQETANLPFVTRREKKVLKLSALGLSSIESGGGGNIHQSFGHIEPSTKSSPKV